MNGRNLKRLFAQSILKNRKEVWDWTLSQAKQAPPPFYSSVDLRDAGFKIVPVDSNLYPAGFNNLCPEDLRTSSSVLRAHIEGWAAHLALPAPKRILVLPESHTQNSFYIENLYYLTQILSEAGFEVRVGWYGEVPAGSTIPLSLVSATQKPVSAFPITIEGGELSAQGFVPDLILLNNDFSSGYPESLDSVRQPIVPSHSLGWHSRKKSEHFVHYNRSVAELCKILRIDPWHFSIESEEVADVNFNEDQGLDRVAEAVSRVLQHTEAAYRERGIRHKPFAFVKNNSGTYGMGILVARSPEELLKLNRRSKNKMSVGKNRLPIQSVVVQEGIPTTTLVDRLAAEPVIYLFGSELIGGFLRTNTERGTEENLNSQGMVFRKLCMTDLRSPGFPGSVEEPDPEDPEESALLDAIAGTRPLPDEMPILELAYGTIARLSALASGRELLAHPPHASPSALVATKERTLQ